MHAFRFKAGIKSRSRRPPATFPLFSVNGVEGEKIEVPSSDYPSFLALPRFRDYIHEDKYCHNTGDLPWVIVDQMAVERVLKKYEISSFASMQLNVRAFGRMIAKIAHCLAIEYLGRKFTPYLYKAIASEHNDEYRKFIRSIDGSKPREITEKISHSWNFNIGEVNGLQILRCDLNMFASYGAPIYQVIVGEIGDFYGLPNLDIDFQLSSPPHQTDALRIELGIPGVLENAQDIRRAVDGILSIS